MLFSVIRAATGAIAPVVLLILLGYWLKCRGFLSRDFLQKGNWLVFHVTLPSTLFINVYKLGSLGDINWRTVIFCLVMVFVLFVLGFFYSVAVSREARYRGVIWQSTFRSNFAILGVAIAAALGGGEAETVAAVAATTCSALFNILAVISLSCFSGMEGQHSVKGALGKIVHNPLIIGGALGFACLLLRELQRSLFGSVVFALNVQLKPFYTVVENLKSITTPFALLVLGGRFEYSAVKGLFKEIAATTVFRLLIAPVIGLGTAIALTKAGILQCGVNEYPAMVALFGSPAAVASAIMASEMGGDEQLATQIVVWTSLLSIASLFLIICVMMALGYLPI